MINAQTYKYRFLLPQYNVVIEIFFWNVDFNKVEITCYLLNLDSFRGIILPMVAHQSRRLVRVFMQSDLSR